MSTGVELLSGINQCITKRSKNSKKQNPSDYWGFIALVDLGIEIPNLIPDFLVFSIFEELNKDSL